MNINDAINIIDKIQGFSDDDSSCGEAWFAVKCYITAAPELLEALENCGEVLDTVRCHLGICGPGDDGERKADAPDNWGVLSALDDCRAAISKAKGGAA